MNLFPHVIREPAHGKRVVRSVFSIWRFLGIFQNARPGEFHHNGAACVFDTRRLEFIRKAFNQFVTVRSSNCCGSRRTLRHRCIMMRIQFTRHLAQRICRSQKRPIFGIDMGKIGKLAHSGVNVHRLILRWLYCQPIPAS